MEQNSVSHFWSFSVSSMKKGNSHGAKSLFCIFVAVLSLFTQFCSSGQLTLQSFYCTVHCACFVLICRELKCLFSVLWCLLVSCETNCSALHSGHYESQMELHGFRRTLNFFGSASHLCSLKTEDWRCRCLFQSILRLFRCFRLFFDLEAIPAGREEVGSIRWGTFGCSNVLLTMCLPGDARLIRLSDRAKLLSEESSVH